MPSGVKSTGFSKSSFLMFSHQESNTCFLKNPPNLNQVTKRGQPEILGWQTVNHERFLTRKEILVKPGVMETRAWAVFSKTSFLKFWRAKQFKQYVFGKLGMARFDSFLGNFDSGSCFPTTLTTKAFSSRDLTLIIVANKRNGPNDLRVLIKLPHIYLFSRLSIYLSIYRCVDLSIYCSIDVCIYRPIDIDISIY